jgi:hypothetical protein
MFAVARRLLESRRDDKMKMREEIIRSIKPSPRARQYHARDVDDAADEALERRESNHTRALRVRVRVRRRCRARGSPGVGHVWKRAQAETLEHETLSGKPAGAVRVWLWSAERHGATGWFGGSVLDPARRGRGGVRERKRRRARTDGAVATREHARVVALARTSIAVERTERSVVLWKR